jgi:hypothetical protein
VAVAVSHDLKRRHRDTSQRAMAAARLGTSQRADTGKVKDQI